jgi:hypothetical protein
MSNNSGLMSTIMEFFGSATPTGDKSAQPQADSDTLLKQSIQLNPTVANAVSDHYLPSLAAPLPPYAAQILSGQSIIP